MSSKTRKILRAISILIVLIVVFLQLDILNIPIEEITENKIWLMIIAYGLLIITSRG
jgi:hypothetical protein